MSVIKAFMAALFETNPTFSVLEEIQDERDRQDHKFGDQSHLPDLDPTITSLRVYSPEYVADSLEIPTADRAKNLCRHAFKFGRQNLALILIEEVCEAIEQAALGNAQALREELIQVSAVCALWVEVLDKRQSKR